MKKEQLIFIIENLIREFKNNSNYYVSTDSSLGIKYYDVLMISTKYLEDNKAYLEKVVSEYKIVDSRNSNSREKYIYLGVLNYILELFQIEEKFKDKPKKKILQNSKDKLEEAGISFENEDYSGTINKLNSAVELALKDELDIPMTINRINTRNVLDVCIKYGIGPVDYLKELIKHICEIDNKVKHQGYVPKKIDAINGIAALEGFLTKAKKYSFEVDDEVKRKIFSNI